ncbi:membrane protein [Exiguobacterium sp. ZOR0005]|uniref:membrane protein n=1 Tax=Exiguobacterium sp. ZOR0005 TaxID=1339226 RepID=UPI000645E5CC|nr:membrane protein [Exiguobacterium sp. ZOR0005]
MRIISLVSVILFFIVEWFMLGRMFTAIDNRLAEGEWTNNVFYRVIIESERATTTLLILFATFFVIGLLMHWLLSTSRSFRQSLGVVGIGWIVPLVLAMIAWVVPHPYIQLGLLVLQVSFIPLIPFIGQALRLGHVILNWGVHVAASGLVLFIQRPSLEKLFRVERTELLERLQGYVNTGELERFERLLEQVDVAQLERLFNTVDIDQLERLLNRVDIDQLIRIFERVNLDQLERILNLFG